MLAKDPRSGKPGGYQGNEHQSFSPIHKLAREIDALYMRHVLREDTWPAWQDVERLIVTAVEEAEG